MAIYFDLEFYVPKGDRNSSEKLKANPSKDGHFLLGGVFYIGELGESFQHKKLQSFWLWNMKQFDHQLPKEAEVSLLSIINKVFAAESQGAKTMKAVGIGSSTSDLPYLHIRSQYHNIAPDPVLFQRFYSGFSIDLSSLAVGFTGHSPFGLEPVPANTLFKEFGLSFEKDRGSRIWELYDMKEYSMIEHRTKQEVENTVLLYSILQEELEQR